MRTFITLTLAAVLFAACANTNDKMSKCENDSWDKVFPLSEKVSHKKVSFPTQYGITLVADLYMPKSVSPQDGLSAKRSVFCQAKPVYFPSFEILLDELRDYRFYADDLVHPSSLAVNYIWERFEDTFCTPQTRNQMQIEHKRWKFEHHRPLH